MTNAKVTPVEIDNGTTKIDGVYDISFDLAGNLNLVSGIDEIIQDITTNLYLVKGEGFINIDAGVDYFGTVFVKGTTRSAIDEEFVRAIENTTGVTRIISYSSNIKRSTRELDINFNVATTYGTTGDTGVTING